ncbi:MAG: hypothetical protein ACK5WF_11855, partial [Cyclobacteriaceae bacterium]
TSIGAPHIWNGEEMGMWGADDPFPRKPVMWKEFKFQPETRNNFQQSPSDLDPVSFNQAHFDFYKKLIAIRKSNAVLTTGKIEFLKAEGKLLGYTRFDDKNEIIVLFNIDDSEHTFSLPANSFYTELLYNQKVISGTITIGSRKSVILKKQ